MVPLMVKVGGGPPLLELLEVLEGPELLLELLLLELELIEAPELLLELLELEAPELLLGATGLLSLPPPQPATMELISRAAVMARPAAHFGRRDSVDCI